MLTIQKLPLCSKGAPVAITLENRSHMRVTLLSYGATIQSIVVPDQNGVPTDVLLGYETVKEYEENDGYLGACIGRNGNRIAGTAVCAALIRSSGITPAAKTVWNSQPFWRTAKRAIPAGSTYPSHLP